MGDGAFWVGGLVGLEDELDGEMVGFGTTRGVD